jgi:hypothetical protein
MTSVSNSSFYGDDIGNARAAGDRVGSSAELLGPVPSDGRRTCPRCGTESRDVAWCPTCGLNLRLHQPPGSARGNERQTFAQSWVAGGAPTERKEARRRGSTAAMAIGVVAVAAAGAAVATFLVTRGSNDPKQAATRVATVTVHSPPVPVTVTTTGRPVTTTLPAPAPSSVTALQMRHVLQRYVNAYGDESVPALRGLFASDLVRTNGTDPSEDLTAALDTYRTQFAGLSSPSYLLANIAYDPGKATATAMYSITNDSVAVGRGLITFHFVRAGGRVLIDDLAIQPS